MTQTRKRFETGDLVVDALDKKLCRVHHVEPDGFIALMAIDDAAQKEWPDLRHPIHVTHADDHFRGQQH